jgi:multiple sugar transport system substrate-binding protein
MRTSRSARLLVVLAAVALVVTACGSSTATSEPAGSQPAGQSAAPPASQAAGNGEVVELRWYCCLGGGDAPEQVEVEQQVAEEFNAAHPDIHLTFEAVPYEGARDALATQIASGNGPDIVGPVGVGGAEAFHGQWLDLQPLIDSTGYDLGQYPDSTVALYNTGGEGQTGIPFAIYPSVLFYKKSHFEEAGLNEPPHEWNGTYTMPDGTERPWDWDTVREIAKILTVDKNGKDATQEGFDPESIVQWGLEPQRDDLRQTGAYWGPGQLAGGTDGTTAEIPDAWKEAWKAFYADIWTDHTTMTGPQFESDELNPSDYPFFTGNVSMSTNYLWSTYGVGDAGDDWDIAATPSYNGTTTAAFNADTFRIHKDTKHPDEAFTALTYLLDEANDKLLTTYGGMPARPEEQDAFFATLQEGFPNQVDWNVAKEGVAFADVPNFESYMPAYNESLDKIIEFGTKWTSTPGLNLDTEIQDLQTQLQSIWDQEG